MKIIIGSDHAGYKAKEELKKHLKCHTIIDKGANSEYSVGYPVYAEKVAREVAKGDSTGILLCGTGMGVCMAANKVRGIRAALAYNESTAKLAKEHNNANILCVGARELSLEKIKKIADIFLKTKFSDLDRHKKRVEEINRIS